MEKINKLSGYKYDPTITLGLRPGEIVHVGEKILDKIRIRLIEFNPEMLTFKELDNIDECIKYVKPDTISWINFDGLHDIDSITKVGLDFGISNLVLEQVVNTLQRPQIEEYEDYIFLSTKMIYYSHEAKSLIFEHFSFILGENYLLTFQERVGDVFEPVRQRLKEPTSRLRNRKSDYLTYALLDVMVDNYFVVIDKLNDNVNDFEDQLMNSPNQETLKQMYRIKRELLKLNRNIRPIREVVNKFYITESKLVEEKNSAFIRDLYGHTVDINESIEINREMVSGMIDTYISITGNKLNEIMKVLTIMASIFIPLTFIAGIYGMNFEHMPELHSKWGYYVTILVMLIIGMGLVIYFRRKKWL